MVIMVPETISKKLRPMRKVTPESPDPLLPCGEGMACETREELELILNPPTALAPHKTHSIFSYGSRSDLKHTPSPSHGTIPPPSHSVPLSSSQALATPLESRPGRSHLLEAWPFCSRYGVDELRIDDTYPTPQTT